MITKPKINSIIAAQYSKDSYWYRAKIISIDHKSKFFSSNNFSNLIFIISIVIDKTVFVFYVDYGNSETVKFSKLRKLDEKDAEQPGQAIPCSLIYVSTHS